MFPYSSERPANCTWAFLIAVSTQHLFQRSLCLWKAAGEHAQPNSSTQLFITVRKYICREFAASFFILLPPITGRILLMWLFSRQSYLWSCNSLKKDCLLSFDLAHTLVMQSYLAQYPGNSCQSPNWGAELQHHRNLPKHSVLLLWYCMALSWQISFCCSQSHSHSWSWEFPGA